MKDPLCKILIEHPDLNPTETYALLSKALTPDVLDEEIDFDAFHDILKQYIDRLDNQLTTLRDKENPASAEGMLEQTAREWFAGLRSDHQDLDSLYSELEDIAWNLPDKASIVEMVDEKIQMNYPDFHEEYLEHQQWLKANTERLARVGQRQLQGEPDQTRNPDGHTR